MSDGEGTHIQALKTWGPLGGLAGRLVLAAAAAFAVLVGLGFALERYTLGRNALGWRVQDGEVPEHIEVEFLAEGIARPRAVAADQARLSDDEPVIGVVVGTWARAYRIAALADRRHHVFNDVVGDVPVTVAYCDLSDCARAFQGAPGDDLLPISTAGLYDDHLVLRVAGVDYLQDSGQALREEGRAFPYPDLPLTRTTWKTWRTEHPETTVVE